MGAKRDISESLELKVSTDIPTQTPPITADQDQPPGINKEMKRKARRNIIWYRPFFGRGLSVGRAGGTKMVNSVRNKQRKRQPTPDRPLFLATIVPTIATEIQSYGMLVSLMEFMPETVVMEPRWMLRRLTICSGQGGAGDAWTSTVLIEDGVLGSPEISIEIPVVEFHEDTGAG